MFKKPRPCAHNFSIVFNLQCHLLPAQIRPLVASGEHGVGACSCSFALLDLVGEWRNGGTGISSHSCLWYLPGYQCPHHFCLQTLPPVRPLECLEDLLWKLLAFRAGSSGLGPRKYSPNHFLLESFSHSFPG